MLKHWKKSRGLLAVVLLGWLIGSSWVQGGKPPKDDPPPPDISYSITRLGTLGGTYSMGRGMNSFGDVVGTSETDNAPEVHAFVYTAEAGMVNLNDLIDPASGWVLKVANDINDAGQIVGTGCRDEDGDGQLDRCSIAFRYTPGAVPVVEELGGLGAPGDNPRPMAINHDGDVGGHSSALDNTHTFGNAWHAVLWTTDTDGDGIVEPTDLGTPQPGTSVFVFALNNDDQLAGWAKNGSARGWRYTPTIGWEDLGVLKAPKKNGTAWVEAYGMNGNGEVAGLSSAGRSDHAFRYSDGGGMQDLGTLGGPNSEANGINISGEVVGSSQIKVGGSIHPWVGFLYTDGTMLELEPLIVDLPEELSGQIHPWRINDSGQICGPYSDNFNFSGEAFLLTQLPLD